MSLETWQAIPAVDVTDLHPILSTLSGSALGQRGANRLGQTDGDSLFGALLTTSRRFQIGRLVTVSALRPAAIEGRMGADAAQQPDSRWFQSAGFMLELSEQQTQGCYGGWHEGFALRVFGG